MNKLVYAIGLIAAIFVLVNVNDGNIGSNDVFQAISVPVVEETIESELDDKIERPEQGKADGYFSKSNIEQSIVDNAYQLLADVEGFDSELGGAVIPYDLGAPELIAEFFLNLQASQEVDIFVVIGGNHRLRGRNNISISPYGFQTPYGNLEPELDLIYQMIDDLDLGNSYTAFREEESILNIVPFLKMSFPDARIVPIAIKDFTKEEDLEVLADYLADLNIDNMLVLAPTEFSQGVGERADRFHDELSISVLETLDKSGLDQLDSESTANLYVLFDYLQKIGWEEARVNRDLAFVPFYEGSAVGDRDLTILAFGDMMLSRHVRVLMDIHGLDYVFRNIRGEDNAFFEGADIVFANLEGPIKGNGTKGGESLSFSFNEDVAPLLKWHGFNLLSISNNHAVDQGWDGRDTTIAALETEGIGWCGHPSEADPESVYYGKVGDKDFAFLCFQDVTYKLDDDAAVALIKSVRPNVDYLVVSVHWGVEYKHRPHGGLQIDPAHAFIDAGADFIIGHHPHVVQSFEIYNDKMIFYSLGNFVFDQYWSVATQEELAIGIVLDDSDEDSRLKTKVYLFPMKSERAQSRLMSEVEYDRWIEEFISYGDYSEKMKTQIRNGVVVW